MEPLDNPVWHALTGPQAEFSEGSSLALRYEPDVSVFGAVPDDPSAVAWDALRELIGPDGVTIVARSTAQVPPGWEIAFELPGHQYVAPPDLGERADSLRFTRLTAADVPEMLALVERTKPGPFRERTVELGTYFGFRDDDGALVAMAGTRMRPRGYTEISAVCTDERARGRGLATALMHTLAHEIREHGDQPMLHTAVDNTNAIAVYEHLGFTRRTTIQFMAIRAPR